MASRGAQPGQEGGAEVQRLRRAHQPAVQPLVRLHPGHSPEGRGEGLPCTEVVPASGTQAGAHFELCHTHAPARGSTRADALSPILGPASSRQVVLPPACFRNSFGLHYDMDIKRNKMEWFTTPVNTLLDVPRVIENWKALGIKVYEVRGGRRMEGGDGGREGGVGSLELGCAPTSASAAHLLHSTNLALSRQPLGACPLLIVLCSLPGSVPSPGTLESHTHNPAHVSGMIARPCLCAPCPH